MKRKFKLFATLASLCLSVALMAFGVYAATNVTYNVNSTVSFAAQVAGEFNWKVKHVKLAIANGTSEHDDWSLANTDEVSGTAIELDGSELNSNIAKTASTQAIQEVEFDPSIENGNTAWYTLTFHNSSSRAATVVAKATQLFGVNTTATNQDSAQLQVFVAANASALPSDSDLTFANAKALATADDSEAEPPVVGGITTASVAANATYYLVIKVVLTNTLTEIANNQINVTLTVTPAAGV